MGDLHIFQAHSGIQKLGYRQHWSIWGPMDKDPIWPYFDSSVRIFSINTVGPPLLLFSHLFSLIFSGNILSWFSSHISMYCPFSLDFFSFEDPYMLGFLGFHHTLIIQFPYSSQSYFSIFMTSNYHQQTNTYWICHFIPWYSYEV